MVAKKVEAFGGMIPAQSDRLLPETAAALSQNAWLYSGELIPLPQNTFLRACVAGSVGKVYRIPNNFIDSGHLADADWLEFGNADTDVVKSPVIGDTFDRYYWASSSSQPLYNTKARIHAGSSPWLLGIPAPTIPGLAHSGGTSVITSVRSYVVTWVSTYGEEGPPSPGVTATGKQDDTWTVTLPAVDPLDTGTNRTLANARIYRTVTASDGTTSFFLVTTVAIATATYADTASDATVSANAILPSTTWSAPPTDIKGMILAPNGMIVGFRGKEVWFCEPYRPHAWPPQYALTVEYPVVGLGVVNQTIVVCTQGNPYALTGVNPASVTETKLANLDACLSKGSILSTPEGVYYSSPNGLILIGAGGVQNSTANLLTKDKWNSKTQVLTQRAARLGSGYYAWGSTVTGVFQNPGFETTAFQQSDFTQAFSGILIDINSQRVAFNVLSDTVPLTNVMNDPTSGEILILRNNNVYWLNIAGLNTSATTPGVLKWRSKIFQLAKKDNIAVARVYFDQPVNLPALNPTPNVNLVQTLASDQWGLFRVYADGVLKYTRELRTSGDLFKLGSGFKADYWQFEFETRLLIKSFQVASSTKELAQV